MDKFIDLLSLQTKQTPNTKHQTQNPQEIPFAFSIHLRALKGAWALKAPELRHTLHYQGRIPLINGRVEGAWVLRGRGL